MVGAAGIPVEGLSEEQSGICFVAVAEATDAVEVERPLHDEQHGNRLDPGILGAEVFRGKAGSQAQADDRFRLGSPVGVTLGLC
ncbi:hypothetical protein D9M68_829310 [compost metagenome]